MFSLNLSKSYSSRYSVGSVARLGLEARRQRRERENRLEALKIGALWALVLMPAAALLLAWAWTFSSVVQL